MLPPDCSVPTRVQGELFLGVGLSLSFTFSRQILAKAPKLFIRDLHLSIELPRREVSMRAVLSDLVLKSLSRGLAVDLKIDLAVPAVDHRPGVKSELTRLVGLRSNKRELTFPDLIGPGISETEKMDLDKVSRNRLSEAPFRFLNVIRVGMKPHLRKNRESTDKQFYLGEAEKSYR